MHRVARPSSGRRCCTSKVFCPIVRRAMYTEFYDLREKPFDLSPSSRFLYLGETHKEALALLTYGLRERKGFGLLTGEVGTGKTTIVHALLAGLDQNVHLVHLSNPLMSPREFLDYLARKALGRETPFLSKAEFLIDFETFLIDCRKSGKNFLLIIDEAHKVSFQLLEEIRLLSNMETAEEKLMTHLSRWPAGAPGTTERPKMQSALSANNDPLSPDPPRSRLCCRVYPDKASSSRRKNTRQDLPGECHQADPSILERLPERDQQHFRQLVVAGLRTGKAEDHTGNGDGMLPGHEHRNPASRERGDAAAGRAKGSHSPPVANPLEATFLCDWLPGNRGAGSGNRIRKNRHV